MSVGGNFEDLQSRGGKIQLLENVLFGYWRQMALNWSTFEEKKRSLKIKGIFAPLMFVCKKKKKHCTVLVSSPSFELSNDKHRLRYRTVPFSSPS